MKLDENNCREIIGSYTYDKWRPLLDLIPEILETNDFGKASGGTKNEDGSFTMPNWESSPVVDEFHRIVYEIPVIISFDWVSWEEGRKIVNDRNFNFDYTDLITKCKIITAIVRNDRFCEGALIDAFRSGLIQRILISLQSQLNLKKN
jgi:hypothetical protein